MNNILGNSPEIPLVASGSDNIPMQYDFRSVYASLLKQWFCVPDSTLNAVMLKNFQQIQVIKGSAPCLSSSPDLIQNLEKKLILTNYPNPFQDATVLSYESAGGHTLLQVFDTEGRLISTLVDKEVPPGNHKVTFENEGYAPGIYYARLQNLSLQITRTMLLVR